MGAGRDKDITKMKAQEKLWFFKISLWWQFGVRGELHLIPITEQMHQVIHTLF